MEEETGQAIPEKLHRQVSSESDQTNNVVLQGAKDGGSKQRLGVGLSTCMASLSNVARPSRRPYRSSTPEMQQRPAKKPNQENSPFNDAIVGPYGVL